MPCHGHVRNDAVVLDEPMGLPDGTEVMIQPREPARRPTLAERFENVIGTADDLPPDMAENHDHYVHGTPMRWRKR